MSHEAALALIDEALDSTSSRKTFDSGEIRDLLLDVRREITRSSEEEA